MRASALNARKNSITAIIIIEVPAINKSVAHSDYEHTKSSSKNTEMLKSCSSSSDGASEAPTPLQRLIHLSETDPQF